MFNTKAEALVFDLVLEIQLQHLADLAVQESDQVLESLEDEKDGYDNKWYHRRMIAAIKDEQLQLEALAEALWDDYCGRMPVGPGQLELPLPI